MLIRFAAEYLLKRYDTFPLLNTVERFFPSPSLFCFICSGLRAPGKSSMSKSLRKGLDVTNSCGRVKLNSAIKELKNDFNILMESPSAYSFTSA